MCVCPGCLWGLVQFASAYGVLLAERVAALGLAAAMGLGALTSATMAAPSDSATAVVSSMTPNTARSVVPTAQETITTAGATVAGTALALAPAEVMAAVSSVTTRAATVASAIRADVDAEIASVGTWASAKAPAVPGVPVV